MNWEQVRILGDSLYPDHDGDWIIEIALDFGLAERLVRDCLDGAPAPLPIKVSDAASLMSSRLGEIDASEAISTILALDENASQS